MLKIQLNNSNHRRIEFTEKSSHSRNFKKRVLIQAGIIPISA